MDGRSEPAGQVRNWTINGVGLAGLALLGWGLWLVSPAASLIALGAILFVLAVFAAVR